MKLPYAHRAKISKKKIVGYLLSASHRDGRHKAKFFNRFGFFQENWHDLRRALRRQLRTYEVKKLEASIFGKRYVIEGRITTPDGRTALLRSVWFIETGSQVPRFVTAYPRREKNQ